MNYIVFKNESALYFECGYSCDNAIFLTLGGERFFITDGRYEIEAKKAVKNAKVSITNSLIDKLIEILKKNRVKKVAIDPAEWDLHTFNKLKESVSTKFKYRPNFSHIKRIIKSEKEIEYLAKAVKIGKKSFKKVAKEISRSKNLNEFKLNFLAESILRDYGSRDIGFEPILAVSENAAKPHALPSNRELEKGDLLLFDAGVKYKRYCSDRTRTSFYDGSVNFKTEQKFGSKKMQKVYDTVLKAHDRAIKKARSGMKAKQIDAFARDVIEKAGFGDYFVHSTGHGVGLDIHEMPYISSRSEIVIEDGMVYTIEPGIYIEGKFGIRIEDMVVMQNGKAKVL